MPHFSILILTIGIPGAGKTEWVKRYKKNHPLTHIISTDELRKEIFHDENCDGIKENLDLIHDEARKRVKEILDNPKNYDDGTLGPEIVVDSTNTDIDEWIKYKNLGSSVILAKVFDVEPEQAMRNQSNRKRVVPMEILQMKWDQYQQNKKYMQYIFNMILDHTMLQWL